MMDAFERFGLLINDRVVKTPVALASMAGIVDAAYVLERQAHTGLAFMGGYSVDAPTLDAARQIAAGGERKEFLFDDPAAEIRKQIELLKNTHVIPAINLRGSSPAAFAALAKELGDGVVYEIDAHCRQPAMVAAGCGEYYLHHLKELCAAIGALKSEQVTVSVKIRAGVGQDDPLLAQACWKAGADILHVDLMDCGSAKIRQIRNSCPLMLIANNSINTSDRMREMLAHGADLVSLARHADERTLAGLDAAITRYADEEGWYNSPKQLCRGGDLRSLTFCCMPVKECPLIPTLNRIGMPREDYIRMKLGLVEVTPLEVSKQTCFGSLAWCCKTSSPCMFRDMTLKTAGISKKEYMRLKRDLSDAIMSRVFHDLPSDNQC